MNFAEQLAYWYLRLNGFLPITNFVLHHGAEHRTSDADLLAVRFPYVSEDVGGQPDDWDKRFSDDWDIDLAAETVGVVVEVKSGGWDANDLTDPAREWRVRDGLKRIGMISPDQLDEAVAELRDRPITRAGGFTSVKLFIGDGAIPHDTPWLHVQLENVDQFVRQWMRNYRYLKSKDRLFFGGDLIQYLAWRSNDPDE